MTSYARINDENIVEEIIEIDSSHIMDAAAYITKVLKLSGTWMRATAGWNYLHAAQVGHTYVEKFGVFVAPKPFNSWIFSESLLTWTAPVPYPDDGLDYSWNEDNLSWSLTS